MGSPHAVVGSLGPADCDVRRFGMCWKPGLATGRTSETNTAWPNISDFTLPMRSVSPRFSQLSPAHNALWSVLLFGTQDSNGHHHVDAVPWSKIDVELQLNKKAHEGMDGRDSLVQSLSWPFNSCTASLITGWMSLLSSASRFAAEMQSPAGLTPRNGVDGSLQTSPAAQLPWVLQVPPHVEPSVRPTGAPCRSSGGHTMAAATASILANTKPRIAMTEDSSKTCFEVV